MSLSSYQTLGRSGLAVSPLALGTMTFGTARWGADEDTSRAMFDAYLEAGGNLVDTADVYAGGRSEEMLGRFIAERGLRDRIVLATKAGFSSGGGPHGGGNGAKHLHAALDGSLRRLRTSHVDLFWLHVWDGVTPAEEVIETMAALVAAGKIRYWGVSNAPAWWVAKLATLAACRGRPAPVALQYFYSLVSRAVEDEHIPLAGEFGLGMMPWSPLAYGLLSGKYDRASVEAAQARPAAPPPGNTLAQPGPRPAGDKRLDGANPFGITLFTERNWRIVDALRRVSAELGQSPARVALCWTVGRPGVTSTLMGVSRIEQVADNIAALDVVLAPEHRAALDAASASDQQTLYSLFTPAMRQNAVFGGSAVQPWRRA